jgi:hypothetical protein
MDLVKARKIVSKNFSDYGVKSEKVDLETLTTFICVDLVREDMTADAALAPSRPKKKNESIDSNG